jgi:hypothetical protein
MPAAYVTLRATAMKNIGIRNIEGDFVFIVGGERYACPRIIAEFLSSRISLLGSVDPSNSEYVVETEDLSKQFKFFLSLGQGSTVRVAHAAFRFLLRISSELGNSELCETLLDNSHGYFSVREIFYLCGDFSIGHLASQFHQFDISEFDSIPLSTLSYILSDDSLRISSEDALYSYLISRFPVNPEYANLLQFIHFEHLSRDSISDFVSAIPNFITHRLWAAIFPRLIPRLSELEFPLNTDKPFDGIISYLTRKHGGNVHDRGIVSITSKSVFSADASYAVRNIADLNAASGLVFASGGDPGQWVCWDFGKMRVRPTHYEIRSAAVKSWVLQSSVDGASWTQIDRQFDSDLQRHVSFPVSDADACRFIRLTQTGKSRAGSHYLAIYALEVYGTLLEYPE